jgi:phosphatidate cytidylyltransferase
LWSLALCLVTGWVTSMLWVTSPYGLTWMLVTAVTVWVFGTLGDLFESLLKRNAGVKDSSGILSDHGGILDRFDSLLFAAVPVYYLGLWWW